MAVNVQVSTCIKVITEFTNAAQVYILYSV